jgi:tRNA pseudouridine13 synthase
MGAWWNVADSNQSPQSELTNASMRIRNPLPQKFLTTEPGVGGRIKARPEDFLVDELPLYEPEGKGEHLYLGIEKSNVAHGELMSCIRRHFNVSERDIGFAGMKDKVGVTRQTISVLLPPGSPEIPNTDINHQRIKVLWAARHRNKIRLGHLAGNRFSIRIRDVEPSKAPLVLRTLRILEKSGVPNYFGAQRFGYRLNNHLIGAALLRGDWDAMLRHLLGSEGGNFPLYQQPRRELFDKGRVAEAAEQWTAADRSERIASTRLAAGKSKRDACLAVGETSLAFWISALQSAIFNRVLDRRIESNLFAQLIEGDIAFKHATRGMFHVTASEIAGGELPARLASLEISPSGPLWGKDMMQPTGSPGDAEREALAAAGIPAEIILTGKHSPEGGRRPFRVSLRDSSIEAGVDEHGNFIRVAFDLPRGAYATIVMREIMKAEQLDSESADE